MLSSVLAGSFLHSSQLRPAHTLGMMPFLCKLLCKRGTPPRHTKWSEVLQNDIASERPPSALIDAGITDLPRPWSIDLPRLGGGRRCLTTILPKPRAPDATI